MLLAGELPGSIMDVVGEPDLAGLALSLEV